MHILPQSNTNLKKTPVSYMDLFTVKSGLKRTEITKLSLYDPCNSFSFSPSPVLEQILKPKFKKSSKWT